MAALPLFANPGIWASQYAILYHGTLDIHVPSILRGVDVSQGRRHCDHGRGFYTTTVERQARSWAWQLAWQYPGTHPAIIRFDVGRDELANLQCLWFVRGGFDADDFWSLVFHCRRGASDHGRTTNGGWYDVVIGPVVASWRQRLAIHDADQISFHTASAAQVLAASTPREIP